MFATSHFSEASSCRSFCLCSATPSCTLCFGTSYGISCVPSIQLHLLPYSLEGHENGSCENVGEVFGICGRRIARKNWGRREQIGCYVMVTLANKLGRCLEIAEGQFEAQRQFALVLSRVRRLQRYGRDRGIIGWLKARESHHIAQHSPHIHVALWSIDCQNVLMCIGCASRPSPSSALTLETRMMMHANEPTLSFTAFYGKRNFTLLSPYSNQRIL